MSSDKGRSIAFFIHEKEQNYSSVERILSFSWGPQSFICLTAGLTDDIKSTLVKLREMIRCSICQVLTESAMIINVPSRSINYRGLVFFM